MAEPLARHRPMIEAHLRSVPRLFCGLDYDGTLAPLAATPAEAKPFPGTAAVLQRLARRPGVCVAIVTGRPIADVRQFLDLPDTYYVGIHGLELQLPGGPVGYSSAGRRARTILPAVAERLQREIGDLPGMLIEDKGAALALHYRMASKADASRGRTWIKRVVAELQDRGEPLDLLQGHKVIEVRPRDVDKGRALCELLASHAPGAVPLYIGDDQTDEDAFRALPSGAITIRVGPADTDTEAAYLARDPAEVHSFLQALAQP